VAERATGIEPAWPDGSSVLHLLPDLRTFRPACQVIRTERETESRLTPSNVRLMQLTLPISSGTLR
jgi:hypothetical protein